LQDAELDATNIDVGVKDCEVTLAGTVGSRYDKYRAEDLAISVPGATHVQNNLRIAQESTLGNPGGAAGTGPAGQNPPSLR
jgi:osmotically-inducible protein OsmY